VTSCIVDSAAIYKKWWSNLEILFGPLHCSSPFIGELRCQAIQTEHGPLYSRENPKSSLYCEMSTVYTWYFDSDYSFVCLPEVFTTKLLQLMYFRGYFYTIIFIFVCRPKCTIILSCYKLFIQKIINYECNIVTVTVYQLASWVRYMQYISMILIHCPKSDGWFHC
jgi:hypothetical protein